MMKFLVPSFLVISSISVALSGCASNVDPDPVAPAAAEVGGDELAESSEDLSTARSSYVTVRRDLRRCASPMCGGFFVRDANRAGQEVYVSGLDTSGLSAAAQAQFDQAPAEELVLRGKLGAISRGYRPFVVGTAFRGMPGYRAQAGDSFSTVRYVPIRCITAPCNQYSFFAVNKPTSVTSVTGVDTQALGSALNQGWLRNRIESKGAIVASRLVTGAQFPGGRAVSAVVSQVYVKLADTRVTCTEPALPKCAAGNVAGYTADENSCLSLDGCFPARACPKFLQICSEGYKEVARYTPPNGCPQLICEPEFLSSCSGPVPSCAAPPPGCNYQGLGCVNGSYTCGTLVCGEGGPNPL
jgi:hypothetical protein